jgi:hypothetical protein
VSDVALACTSPVIVLAVLDGHEPRAMASPVDLAVMRMQASRDRGVESMTLTCRIEALAGPQGREGQREVARNGAISRYSGVGRHDRKPRKPGAKLHRCVDYGSRGKSGLRSYVAEVTVIDIVVAPGGGGVGVTNVSPRDLPGFYLVYVTPNEPQTWKSGVYISGVLVRGARTGGKHSRRCRWIDSFISQITPWSGVLSITR